MKTLKELIESDETQTKTFSEFVQEKTKGDEDEGKSESEGESESEDE